MLWSIKGMGCTKHVHFAPECPLDGVSTSTVVATAKVSYHMLIRASERVCLRMSSRVRMRGRRTTTSSVCSSFQAFC